MNPFTYMRTTEIEGAVAAALSDRTSSFIAGGTGVVDLMHDQVEMHQVLVDINFLPLSAIEVSPEAITIGALVRNSDVIQHPAIREHFPMLTEALSHSATPQIRNMSSVSGNLLQRTRCSYFRDVGFACNKRIPGSGCPAMEGYNRAHAILGTSSACIATHPSDMAVALVALDAVVHTQGPNGDRRMPITDLHRLPGDTPEQETVLDHGELIAAIELPVSRLVARSRYLKVPTDNFSLASVATALEVEDNRIRDVRIALGGVATKPWRSHEAEAALRGAALNESTFIAAAEAAVQDAVPRQYNSFKVDLIQRMIIFALKTVGDVA